MPNVTDEEVRQLLTPQKVPLSARWDKREGEGPCDLGLVGVDADGVWARLHPDLILNDRPELWDLVDAYRRGQRTIRPEDEELSCFEYDAKIALIRAGGSQP